MTMTSTLLAPVVALVLWTLVMWVWMYLLRIPAMSRANIDPQSARHPGALTGLPSVVRQAADNYNHLHEQPTVFYAAALAMHLAAPEPSAVALGCAWTYVGLRVAHSLVQATINVVVLRFALFTLSTFALAGLALSAAAAILG